MCKTPKTLVCRFESSGNPKISYIIEIERETSTIIGEFEGYPIWYSYLQDILNKYLKRRPGDIVDFRRCGLYINKIDNQYGQIQERICNALKHKLSEIEFKYDIYHEIQCNCCNKNWFTPRYTHINMCEDCVECIFD